MQDKTIARATDSARSVPTYGLYGEASAEAGDFWIHAEPIASRSQLFNWEIARHRHENFFQILYIRNGEGDALFGQDIVRLGQGSLVLVPPRITHGFRFSQDIDGQVITTLADRLARAGTTYGHNLSVPSVLALDLENPDDRYLLATVDRLVEEISRGIAPRTGLVDAYLDIILGLAPAIDPKSGLDGEAKSQDRVRIQRLNNLIGAHFRQHRPIEFYAGRLGLSPTHLNRIARSQTGRTISGLLTDRIISEARRGLLFSIMSIQDIALDLGFSDPAYFSRYFRNAVGETPRAFRERQRRLADARN